MSKQINPLKAMLDAMDSTARNELLAHETNAPRTITTTTIDYSDMTRDEQIARLFHDTYERLAPKFGYETRTETRQFDPESANGKLMVAVCAVVSEQIARAVIEACAKVCK